MHIFPLICLLFIYQNVRNSYEIIHSNTRYCTLYNWAESRAIINDLDVILQGFMLQVIKNNDFPSKTVKLGKPWYKDNLISLTLA